MARTGNEKKKRKKGSSVNVLLVFIIIALLLAGAAGYYYLVYKPANAPKEVVGGKREADALKGSINLMTEEEIQEALNQIVEEGMFRISIASSIIAEEHGKAEVRIENNITNRYIMQVTLYTTKPDPVTGETIQNEIYRTDYIDPGYYIQAAKFDKHLEPGLYDGLAVFTALYPDTEEIAGRAGAQVRIYVFPDGQVPTPTPSPTPTPTPTPVPGTGDTFDTLPASTPAAGITINAGERK